MKNVTIVLDERVADWARIEAAKRRTSVSRMVGEMLAEKMRGSPADKLPTRNQIYQDARRLRG
jgi:hypothetical protein